MCVGWLHGIVLNIDIKFKLKFKNEIEVLINEYIFNIRKYAKNSDEPVIIKIDQDEISDNIFDLNNFNNTNIDNHKNKSQTLQSNQPITEHQPCCVERANSRRQQNQTHSTTSKYLIEKQQIAGTSNIQCK